MYTENESSTEKYAAKTMIYELSGKHLADITDELLNNCRRILVTLVMS